ncbi:unnamed protein product, partial [Symbiodinium necroappetens]
VRPTILPRPCRTPCWRRQLARAPLLSWSFWRCWRLLPMTVRRAAAKLPRHPPSSSKKLRTIKASELWRSFLCLGGSLADPRAALALAGVDDDVDKFMLEQIRELLDEAEWEDAYEKCSTGLLFFG